MTAAGTLRTIARRGRRHVPTVLAGGLAGLAGVAGSYAVAGFTPEFVAAPIAGFMAKTMPGAVITFAILVLGSLGQKLNLLTAIGLGGLLLGLAPIAAVAKAHDRRTLVAGVAGVVGIDAVLAYVLTGAVGPAVGAGIGAGIVTAIGIGVGFEEGNPLPTEVSPGRRRVLGAVVGAVGIALSGTAIARSGVFGKEEAASQPLPEAAGSGTEDPTALLDLAAERSLGVEGIEPLVSQDFYEVDINATNPDPSAEDWTLEVTGAAANTFTLDYEELTGMEAEHRFVTLRCVGENLNGKKMDNALWTGVPLAPLVDRAQPLGECECVMLRAEDGYFEEFPLEALRAGFLAFGMNGKSLPRGHGHPVRALIPGHWGEINVKWLTEIEFLDREAKGYWERRGWHGTGPVNTVAKLHAVNRLDDGRIQVGGHAYAGVRGIADVEVSIDGGETWRSAVLSERLPGVDVWRQWQLEYDPPEGEHEVVVRAIDGTGTTQPEDRSQAFPSGATGWVSRTVTP